MESQDNPLNIDYEWSQDLNTLTVLATAEFGGKSYVKSKKVNFNRKPTLGGSQNASKTH